MNTTGGGRHRILRLLNKKKKNKKKPKKKREIKKLLVCAHDAHSQILPQFLALHPHHHYYPFWRPTYIKPRHLFLLLLHHLFSSPLPRIYENLISFDNWFSLSLSF